MNDDGAGPDGTYVGLFGFLPYFSLFSILDNLPDLVS